MLPFYAALYEKNNNEQAEGYCLKLQQCGLTASIAPDANFEGGGDEGGEDGE